MKKSLSVAALAIAATCGSVNPALAQVAGATTTMGISVVESTRVALGWSVKKSLLGKVVYNDANQRVGKVEDLIISPDKNVSYVIVGAGGFIGIGRHDVAIPVTQIQDQAGKLVMAGATKDTIKALPRFDYANDNARREQFVAAAERDIAAGNAKVSELEQKAALATAEAKAKLDLQITALRLDLKSAQAKLTELKAATAARWASFSADVSAATARLRRSIESPAN